MKLFNQFQSTWKQHKSAKFRGPPAQYAFAKDLGSSSLFLLAMVLAAWFDREADLEKKFMVQASGISYLVATYSEAFIVVVILAKMHFQKTAPSPHTTTSLNSTCNEMPIALQRSYLGVISFGVVATYFHAMGIDEMGSDPHPLYSCYFCVVGAFILYWHARGLIDLLVCSDVSKNVSVRTASIRRAQAHFLCLGVLPLVLCLTGASHAVNLFLFNGYGFFHATVGLDPLLGQAITDFPGKNAFKLKTLRLLLPTIGFSFLVESTLVETCQIDPHAILHVLSGSYVLLMHSCLSSLPRLNESSKSS
jgi:hypothetical protein